MLLEGLDHHYAIKMSIVTYYLLNPQYSNKEAFISFFVSHGPQILTISVLMVLIVFLGHFCDHQNLKPTILTFFGIPRLAQTRHIGVDCN